MSNERDVKMISDKQALKAARVLLNYCYERGHNQPCAFNGDSSLCDCCELRKSYPLNWESVDLELVEANEVEE